MKRKMISVLFAVVLVLSFSLMSTVPVAADAAITIYVPDDYPTIQEAIIAASPGDTISVAAGTYTENVDVNKQVTIIGTGEADTIVTAADWEDHVFEVTADGVSISALTATGANRDSYNYRDKSGIFVNASGCTISSVTAEDNNIGIYLKDSQGSTVTSCTVTNNIKGGIWLEDSHGNIISGNDASSNVADDSTWASTQSWAGLGIYLDSSSNNQLTGNTANWNKGGSQYSGIGIYLDKCPTELGEYIDGNLEITYFSPNVLTDNTANENEGLGDYEYSGVGILLGQSGGTSDNKALLSGNTANGNTYAGTTREKSGSGVVLYQTPYADVIDNTVTGNQQNGYYSEGAIGNYVHDNVVTGNTATENKYGLYLCNDSSNYSNNTITGNTDTGIYGEAYGGMKLTGTVLRANNISGNTLLGASFTSWSVDDNLDARENWWGDPTGPSHASNPVGNGGIISDGVKYGPWYIDAARTTLTPAHNVTKETYHHSIQAGIDAADPAGGDTITVAAGTYNENVVIDKTLTLEGANTGIPATGARGPESIIDAQLADYGVFIIGETTTATLDGFTVRNYEVGGILAGAFSPPEDDPFVVHILNNVVEEPSSLEDAHNNNIQVGDGTTGTIIGNEVSGALLESEDWSGSGIIVAGSSNVLVSNNYVHNCEGGIQITGYLEYRDAPAEDNVIEYNLVEDNESGIVPQMYSMGTIIRYNDVLNNDEGIAVMAIDYSWEHSTPSGTEIYFNNIVGNEYGVKSGLWGSDTGEVLAEEVNATNNWWGHASGPIPPGTYVSYGDKVSDAVLYNPWLLDEVTAGVPPTTYDRTLALKDGWTLISVDKAVADSAWVGTEPLAKELEETISALKYDLVPAIGELAFDSATTSDLEPLTSIYVKTNGGGGVGFNYEEEGPAFYCKDLEAGWNLIGIPSIEAGTPRDVLSPLRYVTVGTQQIVGLTTLVGQGDYNQFSDSFYFATLTDNDWDALAELELFGGYWADGYWAYMEAADTFEVIP